MANIKMVSGEVFGAEDRYKLLRMVVLDIRVLDPTLKVGLWGTTLFTPGYVKKFWNPEP